MRTYTTDLCAASTLAITATVPSMTDAAARCTAGAVELGGTEEEIETPTTVTMQGVT